MNSSLRKAKRKGPSKVKSPFNYIILKRIFMFQSSFRSVVIFFSYDAQTSLYLLTVIFLDIQQIAV